MISFTLYPNLINWVLLLPSLCCRWGSWGTKKLSDLSNVKQLQNDRIKIPNQAVLLEAVLLSVLFTAFQLRWIRLVIRQHWRWQLWRKCDNVDHIQHMYCVNSQTYLAVKYIHKVLIHNICRYRDWKALCNNKVVVSGDGNSLPPAN